VFAALGTLAWTAPDASPVASVRPYAAIAPICAGSTCSVTFAYTGSEQTFSVPVGVQSLSVTAVGAAGAAGGVGDPMPVSTSYNGGPDGPAGLGGRITASLAVIPGATLFVEVGGRPTTDPARCVPKSLSATVAVSCVGGWNGGGDGGSAEKTGTVAPADLSYAGGGGGATDVRTVSRTGTGSLSSRLIVAGGGGGGGGSDIGALDVSAPTANGGAAGGNADSPGADGEYAPGSGGAAGKPSGSSDGGSPNAPNPGHAGSAGLGGAGAKTAGVPISPAQSAFLGLNGGGGGGGGGYWGGGGGGPQPSVNPEVFTTGPPTGQLGSPHAVLVAAVAPVSSPTGGGGGGGGSWAGGKGVRSVPSADAAQVVLSWKTVATTTPTPPRSGQSTVRPTPVISVRVTPVGPSGGSPLASTGTRLVARLVVVGVLLVAAGVVALGLVAGRRRRG
jgi:hypothetical protein